MGGAKERGCREDGERERVCSHSEREKRYKGREANRERSIRRAEGRWGGRFRTTLPGHWDWGETYGNCFLIKTGGRGRLMTTALSMRKKTSSKQKKLELQRCAVCLGDNMGQRRPSTSCAQNWKFLKKKKTASWIQRSMEGETITFLIKAKLDV
ncbi:hypothetical protein CesoFtcFv8_000924 [Champsocephalus esox]|uniref:Uncharacterized protein n=1 Tax=Champsocephalus esox TaxID=159716 RepID=A0AAN8D660_9TELE|nr:hypothetical protein CesoFtcFv8_000924 [Champsocephalus esox]